jgi:hypothetical protein
MIFTSSNNIGHPVTKNFTTLSLHHSCQQLTFAYLNFTQLHFTTLSFGLTPFKFPALHFTSHHYNSLHCTFSWFSPHICYFNLTQFVIAFLTFFKNLRFATETYGRFVIASHIRNVYTTRKWTEQNASFLAPECSVVWPFSCCLARGTRRRILKNWRSTYWRLTLEDEI